MLYLFLLLWYHVHGCVNSSQCIMFSLVCLIIIKNQYWIRIYLKSFGNLCKSIIDLCFNKSNQLNSNLSEYSLPQQEAWPLEQYYGFLLVNPIFLVK